MGDPAAYNSGQQAFEVALAPAIKAIYKAAYHMTHNQDEAEDLVQEAAVLAYRAFHTFEPGTNFKAWFLRILTNVFYSRHRKRKHQPQTIDIEDAPELYLYSQSSALRSPDRRSDPAAAVLAKIDSEAITAALQQLPDDYRIVATMYFIDEFSYQEIAEMIDCPIGTVRSRLHRARKLLQKTLWDMATEHDIISQVANRKE